MIRRIIYQLTHMYQTICIRVRSRYLIFIFNCPKNVKFGKVGLIEGVDCMHIGERCVFNDYFFLTAWPDFTSFRPELKIGENCCFGAYNHISCINKITIGRNLLSGKWVTIVDNSHGDTDRLTLAIPPKNRQLVSKGPVIIGDNVWIGDKVTILPGVSIGDCAVIAANSVITKDIPPYVVAGGNPAVILRSNK